MQSNLKIGTKFISFFLLSNIIGIAVTSSAKQMIGLSIGNTLGGAAVHFVVEAISKKLEVQSTPVPVSI